MVNLNGSPVISQTRSANPMEDSTVSEVVNCFRWELLTIPAALMCALASISLRIYTDSSAVVVIDRYMLTT